ncbi:MAG: glycosyltransferase family 39 protein [Actinomycetota bacterium]|nr:glycosyltransferase family 39 protein [Actinomycetota bacterium]
MPISLAIIVLGGAVVRLAGIGWGLPLHLHPDEWVIVDGAIDMAKRHSFEPAYYFRPDHLEMQLSNLAYLGYSYIFHGSSPVALMANNAAPFFLISRLITACFGIAMIVLAYRIGRRFNQVVGVLSALFCAFFPPFVLNSHFATPDVPLTFAFMIVILGCMRYLETPGWRNVIMASLGVAIAIAIKYPGAFGTIMIAIVVIMRGIQDRNWRRIFIHGIGAIGAVIGLLFLISPVLFTNGAVVVSSVTGEAGGSHLGADNLGWFAKVAFYATDFATGAGITMVLLFLLGIFWSRRFRLRQSIPLWIGAIIWPLLAIVPLHWSRWGLPMYLTPLLIGPIGLYYTARFIRQRPVAVWVRWTGAAVCALLVANLVLASVAVSVQLVAPNTQSEGRDDFASLGVTAKNTISDGYTPFVPGGYREIFDRFAVVDGRLVVNPAVPDRAKMRYVAVSSAMYDRFDGEPKYQYQQLVYTLLSKQFPLVTTLRPVPSPDPSVFAVVAIWRSLAFLDGVLGGGDTGPTVKLYAIPANRR